METLEQLNAFDSEAFEIWLEHNFRAQYGTDADLRYRAFDFRHLGVPFGDSHVDQLHTLYTKLSIDAQRSFRDAAEALFRHAPPGDFPSAAMADLVLIMGLVRAYRALNAFGPVLGSGPWGELHRSLFYDALSVLLMFDRTNEAYAAAKALATSVNFPDVYVSDAYLILVRSRPRNWAGDLALLRQRFASLRRRIEESGDSSLKARLERRQQDLADSLAQAVPLSELASQLPHLRIGPYEPGDTWLVDRLLGRVGSLRLVYSRDGRSLLLVYRADPDRTAVVSPDTAFVAFCIAKGHLFADAYLDAPQSELSPDVWQRLHNCYPSLAQPAFSD
jgi:hypothetical protein